MTQPRLNDLLIGSLRKERSGELNSSENRQNIYVVRLNAEGSILVAFSRHSSHRASSMSLVYFIPSISFSFNLKRCQQFYWRAVLNSIQEQGSDFGTRKKSHAAALPQCVLLSTLLFSTILSSHSLCSVLQLYSPPPPKLVSPALRHGSNQKLHNGHLTVDPAE